jgi:hypothetical protein
VAIGSKTQSIMVMNTSSKTVDEVDGLIKQSSPNNKKNTKNEKRVSGSAKEDEKINVEKPIDKSASLKDLGKQSKSR